MKVILSRKGFDSSYGGYPSLILDNDKLISLPIPEKPGQKAEIKYSCVNSCYRNMTMYEIMNGIKNTVRNGGTVPLTRDTYCHLDPDLNIDSTDRDSEWRGSFGQEGVAQKVMEKNSVGKGDIILFFGWFKNYSFDINSNIFVPEDGNGKHIIYGYMEIEKVLTNDMEIPKWLEKHPHTLAWRRNKDDNCIYIARKELSFKPSLPGYGIFKYSKELDLTKEGLSRSRWELPNCFRGKKITYHSDNSWRNGYFQSALRGQEFIIEEDDSISEWAKNIILDNCRKETYSKR